MIKCILSYTHASKTQEFNCKMNVILANLEANYMGMNVSIPHYGWMIIFVYLMYGWKK